MLELEDFRKAQPNKEEHIIRAGETSHPPFRTERFFNMQGDWYYTLRGGRVRGPFPSRKAALHELHSKLHIDQDVSHNWETHTL